MFRCRVDFKQAPTFQSEINLEIFGKVKLFETKNQTTFYISSSSREAIAYR